MLLPVHASMYVCSPSIVKILIKFILPIFSLSLSLFLSLSLSFTQLILTLSLKRELEKVTNEKNEIHRHYIMVSKKSSVYGHTTLH